ncbi:hypothetical protein [Rossellomorea sp. DUT-2]
MVQDILGGEIRKTQVLDGIALL